MSQQQPAPEVCLTLGLRQPLHILVEMCRGALASISPDEHSPHMAVGNAFQRASRASQLGAVNFFEELQGSPRAHTPHGIEHEPRGGLDGSLEQPEPDRALKTRKGPEKDPKPINPA